MNNTTTLKMNKCNICPRVCNVSRLDKKTGYCGETADIMAARAALHMWEEPCISGTKGSGTIFFSGCNLRCVFCQNRDIALAKYGEKIDEYRLKEICYELKEKGALNINLVTPSHYIYQIADTLRMLKDEKFDLPIVYNTSSYENADTLSILDGLVDIYIPDLKYANSEISKKYSNAENYFEVAKKAIAEMKRQISENEFENNLMKKGIIVRHMILPGHTNDSKDVIKYLLATYGNSIYISIMSQYTPMDGLDDTKYHNINRKITKREYDKVVDYAIELGIENGFIQDIKTATHSFIPKFDGEGILKQTTS